MASSNNLYMYKGDLLDWCTGCSLGTPTRAVSHWNNWESSVSISKSGCLTISFCRLRILRQMLVSVYFGILKIMVWILLNECCLDQKQLGRGRVYFTLQLWGHSITKGSQGKDLGQKPRCRNWSRDHGGMLLTSLLLPLCLLSLLS